MASQIQTLVVEGFDDLNQVASTSIYSTLTQGSYRLLRILSARNANIIECELRNVTAQEASRYRALSYVWGEKSEPHVIKLHNYPYRVTKNLSAALRHFQDTEDRDEIWIDAVCINQSNTAERDAQVRMMPRIYEIADVVLVWLGQEAEDSDLAVDTLNSGQAREFDHEWVSSLFRQEDFEQILEALMSLLTREYWTRLWVVQEIAYARHVHVQCGSQSFAYSSLIDLLGILKQHEMNGTKMISTRAGRIIRLYLGAVGPTSLGQPGSARAIETFEDPAWLLARNAASKKCLDLRDRIYACYGLFHPDLRACIRINYAEPSTKVILEATKAIIRVSRRLDIILLQHRASMSQAQSTWLPVLDDQWGKQEIFFDMLNPRDQRSACGVHEAICHIQDNTIRAKGILIGRVVKVQHRNYQRSDYMYGQENEHIALVEYIFGFLVSLGDTVNSQAELIMFWSALLDTYFNRNLIFQAQQEEDTFTISVDHNAQIISFAVELQKMLTQVANRSSIIGRLKSFVRIPLFSPYQASLIEPLFRHFDYRVLFSFQCDLPSLSWHSFCFENETARAVHIGLGPAVMQEGDVICILYGCKVPVILRPHESKFFVVGDAQLNDFMTGSACTSHAKEQDFDIE